MHLAKLINNVGQRLRIRPTAVEWEIDRYRDADDVWILNAIGDDNFVTLTNARTQHELRLAADQIHSFTSSAAHDRDIFDGFLELKVKVDISEPIPRVDVILSGAARMVQSEPLPPLQVRLSALLNGINPEILRAVKSGRFVVPVMIADHKARHLNLLSQEKEFGAVLSMRPNGSVCIGLGSRIGGHIHDLDESGVQHGYVLTFKPR
jgi:hypothetical protein